MPAVALALLSSVFWGAADFGGGLVSRRVSVAAVVLLSQAAGGVVLLPVSTLSGQPFPHYFGLAMAAGVFGVIGLLLFYRGLAIGKMSLVAPVAACGAMLPVLFSLATGQVPRTLTLAGLTSALVGVVLASMTSASGTQGAAEHPREAALAAIGAAVCFGLFLLLLGRAAQLEPHSALWLSLCTRLASVPTLALGLLLTRTPLPWSRLNPRHHLGRLAVIALVGLGDATANTLFALANTIGVLAVVAVLGSLYPLVTAGLARVRLGELLSPRQKAGAGLAMLGVVLVSLP
ncbi:MAG TPA: DMT family transporter [Candidatus Dormibacteraeota bacterium]|nr:DMT family transporter [Candidatus Dormibacteraeota bacterium]